MINDPEIGGIVLDIPRRLIYQKKDLGKMLVISFKGGMHLVSLGEVTELLNRYGKTTDIQLLKSGLFRVVFEDERDAADALKDLQDREYRGHDIQVSQY